MAPVKVWLQLQERKDLESVWSITKPAKSSKTNLTELSLEMTHFDRHFDTDTKHTKTMILILLIQYLKQTKTFFFFPNIALFHHFLQF